MFDVLKVLISAVAGYLLGSINTSLVVGKFYGTDVRKHGSGNAGATNTLRTLGKTAALFVLIGDILKGILACLIGLMVFGRTGEIIAGSLAIIGHNWPLYFGFRGGKGVLTSFSVLLVIDYKIALLVLLVFIIVTLATRYVSLSSISAAVALPILAIILKRDLGLIVFYALLGLLVIIRHRSNIERLLKGTEPKIGKKHKKTMCKKH